MANPETIKAIGEIEDAEEQIEALEAVVERVNEEGPDAESGEALLKLMERCADDDDFGLFSAIENIIDELDERDTLLRASVGRRPMWKTLEMIGEEKEDVEVLEAALKTDLDESVREMVQEALSERKEA